MSTAPRWLLSIALLAPASLTAQSRALDAHLSRRIDSLFAAYATDSTPGYALGIIRNGQLIYAKGYGLANLDDRIAITPRTAFHLASLSKQFTASAIALLILDKKLSLETPVEQFFPEVHKYHADLRIKHLMYFTSGLHDYTTLPRANKDPWYSSYYFTIDDAIATSLHAESLEFAPGSRWEYSNVDFMMLAKIAERVSGMPLAAFLQQRIFTPLGMRHSSLNDDATLVVPNRATGYALRSDTAVRAQLASVGVNVRPGTGYIRLVRNSPHYGGSGVFTTIEDFAKWDAEFDSPRVLGPAFLAQMMRREKFAHDKDNDAFGLVVGEFEGREMVWFSGGDLDGSTYFARLPKERLTVVCLSNIPTGDAEARAKAVLTILMDSASLGRKGH
ncbi:MAG TPA: serine hydrolase domain-containing protein [Gemmatimonadaceae bacterium]|nr:serine hydrolase domain-containing protein [Gemmatimonadaceae bacterium]